MKTTHEILTLMYREYVNDIDPDNPTEVVIYSGLCSLICALWRRGKITEEEIDIAKEYLYKNQPNKLRGDYYFWTPWVRRHRLMWLRKHMAITK